MKMAGISPQMRGSALDSQRPRRKRRMTGTGTIPQPRPSRSSAICSTSTPDAPVQSMMRLAAVHGPIFRLTLGERTLTIVGSQALTDEICDESRFAKKVQGPLAIIRDFAGDGLFTAYNEEPNWAKAHRLLMPAFGPLGIRAMFDKMEDIADQMLLRWERFGPDRDHRRRRQHDAADARHDRALRVRLSLQQLLPERDAPLRRRDGGGARRSGRARPQAEGRLAPMLHTARRYEADVALMATSPTR
jgi:cytochrome P450/NADPH-cytochrome P450 reductase